MRSAPHLVCLFAFLSLLSLVAARASLADCIDYGDYLRMVSNRDFGAVNDMALAGNRVYVVSDHLTAIDITDVEHPSAMGTVTWGSGWDAPFGTGVAVSADHAYVCDYGLGLVTIDLQALAAVGWDYNPLNDITVSGHYAFATNGDLVVYDIANPDTPVQVATLSIPGYTDRINRLGNFLYIQSDGDIRVVDITNPLAPVNAGTIATPYSTISIAAFGSSVYALDRSGEWSGVLSIYDVTQPRAPVLKGRASINDLIWGTESLAAADARVFATTSDNLFILDVSNPSAPFVKSRIRVPHEQVCMTVRLPYAYIGAMSIIDVAHDQTPPLAGGLDTATNTYDLAFAGTSMFTADLEDGVSLFDVSDMVHPTYRNNIDTPGTAAEVLPSFVSPHLYVADGDTGIQVLERLDGWPWLGNVCSAWIGHGTWGLAMKGQYLYTAGDAGLDIFDVADPANLVHVGSARYGRAAGHVVVRDQYAYMANSDGYSGGLTIVDISNPQSPHRMSTLDLGASTRGIAIPDTGSYAFLTNRNQLQVINIANPAAPFAVTAVPVGTEAHGVAIAGTTAYVTESGFYAGYLDAIDITDPTDPSIIGGVAPAYNAAGVCAKGDYIYLACLFRGFQIAYPQCPRSAAVPPEAPVLGSHIARLSIRPNPMTGSKATIVYDLPRASRGALALYDVCGRLVRSLEDGPLSNGVSQLVWDGRDDAGRRLPGGLYFLHLTADGGSKTARFVVLAP